ncbi:MAG: leucine-rich repeat domain-containing protein, partial [Planctomycetota bacterium]
MRHVRTPITRPTLQHAQHPFNACSLFGRPQDGASYTVSTFHKLTRIAGATAPLFIALILTACATPSQKNNTNPRDTTDAPAQIGPTPKPATTTEAPVEDPVLAQWRRDYQNRQPVTPPPKPDPKTDPGPTPQPPAPTPPPGLLSRIPTSRQAFDTQKRLTELDLSTLALTPDDLAALPDTLTRLNLAQTNLIDDHLSRLYHLHRLKTVDLHDTSVTALGLRKLTQALPALNIESFGPRSLDDFLLRIPSDRVTVASGQWTALDLSDLPLTAHDLQHLAQLTSLQSLNLAGLPLTDAALQHLYTLTNLRHLTLSDDAPVSLPARLELHRQLPNLQPGPAVRDHRDFIRRIEAR